MSNAVTNVISVTKVRQALQKLLAGYELEKEENERAERSNAASSTGRGPV